ncbi:MULTISPECIES: DUF3221 domain-containing protein [unclassified Paenibacillus]|uniref:DUF3221 domain-containing protein n=1 Tax=unclassified Paenibacillus TaxID=185978 RepID=UPI0024057588|nr:MULTISPECIES: DUF3221 domain-containing protein [unclassified Paenibacillus]MDF9839147.1 hypothetical protein [Paenibacillus sp. PastF-2]MDF9845729.1 hypothetical protein [Paenibacillus sp. PastM-2]MDF9852301.1 hypothetical protein [Paenibacillus sp. PastF-1]MDH6477970.1 hypothetical protein [Paenibacillus sp. PastH-2]MDH6505705.1 hypothetical protein [Paenibacillus sp. PastM-3]
MFRWKTAGISFGMLGLLLAGCADAEDVTSTASPAASSSQAVSPSAGQLAADPEKVQLFLTEESILNGDIYLEDNLVHINIVGLDSGLEQRFADKFTSGSYILHDVKYSAAELDAAQKLLADQDLHKQLNLYGSWVDVRENKLGVTVPDDYLEAAEQTLNKLIDPGMLRFEVQELGEPSVTGTIVEVKSETVDRILILEPGKEAPTYWFSFNDRSELYDAAGQKIEFTGLKKGQQVHIWGTGTVLESLPAQATVRRIELIE